jgi:hypothetical protein
MILVESLKDQDFSSLLETCIRLDVVWFQIFDKSEGPVSSQSWFLPNLPTAFGSANESWLGWQ